MEVLFEASIVERSKYSWPYAFLRKPTKDLQFGFSVDEMLDLRAIDPEKEFPTSCQGGT